MDYGNYALRRNPFPHHGSFPLGDENEEIYALLLIGREKLKEKLDSKLRNLREGESSSLVLILGDYGSGKTHCLKYLEYRSRQKYSNIIPLYIKTIPGIGIRYLLQAVIKSVEYALGREYLIDLARSYLSSEQKIKCSPDIRNFLNAIATGKALVALRWLMGYKLNYEERKELEIIADMDEALARESLSVLFKLLWRINGIKLLLLVDEAEEILKYDKGQIYNFYAGLRDLIDNVSDGMMMILAATPAIVYEEEKGIAVVNPALMSRISNNNIIELSPMDRDNTIKLILSYLKAFRVRKTKRFAGSYPFESNSLKLIAKLSEGAPRKALILSGLLLREGIAHRKSVIDEDFARKIMNIRREVIEEILMRPPVAVPQPTRPTKSPEKRRREAIELKVIKILENCGGSETRYKLYLKAGKSLKKDEFYKILESLAENGKIKLIRRSRGYRINLVV